MCKTGQGWRKKQPCAAGCPAVTPGCSQSWDGGGGGLSMGSRGVCSGCLQPRLPATQEQGSARMHSSEPGWPSRHAEVFLPPSAGCTRAGSSSFPEPSHSSYFTVYSHLCLQGNWDKAEVLAGLDCYSLLSGDGKHLSLLLVLTGAEVLCCLRRIAAARYELWMK